LHIASLDNLPYDNILVPLSVFFAGEPNKQKKITNTQRKEILRWFWLTCLSRKYNSQPVKSLREDVAEFAKLKNGELNKLTHPVAEITAEFFIHNTFRLNSVLSRTFILLLAQNGPRSLISGNKIDLMKALKDYNRNEFHHIYPRSFLKTLDFKLADESCLANICFLSRSDNNFISGDAPSKYRAKLSDDMSDIEGANFLPASTFSDNFDQFIKDRALLLADYAKQLMLGQPNKKK
jgi:hypothetical protein